MRSLLTLSLALLVVACRKGDPDPDGDGVLTDEGDCQPFDANIAPGVAEVCNGVDDDCSGIADDNAVDAKSYFADADSDGFGDAAAKVTACEVPVGATADGTDCDDADPSSYPGAAEADCADPIDHNCDGSVGFADADGDGVPACEDCDDADDTSFPGAPEVCDAADNDCDGTVDEDPTNGTEFFLDLDGDGAGNALYTQVACAAPDGFVSTGDDCDDLQAAASPSGTEICDGIDNDCDGTPDDGVGGQIPFYADTDADGYGDASNQVTACSPPVGYVRSFEDCNDGNAAVHPGAEETNCADPVDYNCDGAVGTQDTDADGFQACDDCDDLNKDVHPGAVEACNEIDDNCDGKIDESAPTWYADIDGDGFGGTRLTVAACVAPTGFVASKDDCDDLLAATHPGAVELCDGADNNCDTVGEVDGDADGFFACKDCDDAAVDVHPGALEWCNLVDDDCDGSTDEGAVDRARFYADVDGDKHGTAGVSALACAAPGGFVASDDDCDDTAAARFPGAIEVCDDVDQDCDGVADDGLPVSAYWKDGDSDGWGAGNAVADCSAPVGYVSANGDCDDKVAAVNPAAVEKCGGGDENCDGVFDVGATDTKTFYADLDGDKHYGNRVVSVACSAPPGFGASFDDCDDLVAASYPGALEICDNLDNDCDGTPDDGAAKGTYFKDSDGDGYGDTTSTTLACFVPAGYASASGDCNDASKTVNPGAAETCNGVDDNCDGTKDEGLLGSGAACAAVTCKDLHTLRPTLGNGSYYISPSGAAFSAYCDMTTNGGGWTLAAHFYDLTNANEDAFNTRFAGSNRWTDEAWSLTPSGTLGGAAPGGLVPNSAQGAIDIDGWTNRWTDLRMGCNLANSATVVSHFIEVDDYTTINGNYKLLGGAPNGRKYTVPAASNSFNQTSIWHDNEISGTNSGHYLCDYTNTPVSGNGSSQFGFCYTDHLNNDNTLDMGDSIVSLAWGSAYGSAGDWSPGFTGECGNMGATALQNTGTWWLWIR